jgi:radical SAM-linked protein
MLPESKLMEKARLRKLPELERPRTVRLKFKKVGSLQYISHLDLQRTFMRVIVRSCIPAWYTKGFNPHAKLVFSTPLSVGAQSVCEYLDIRIDRDMSCEDIRDRLNAELTDELCILDAYLPENDFSQIAWASYEIEVFTRDADASLAKKANEILTTSPLVMTKRTKSGEKDVDITTFIKKISFNASEGQMTVNVILSAGSTENLNPEYVVTAIKENGLFGSDAETDSYRIMRNRVYDKYLIEFK